MLGLGCRGTELISGAWLRVFCLFSVSLLCVSKHTHQARQHRWSGCCWWAEWGAWGEAQVAVTLLGKSALLLGLAHTGVMVLRVGDQRWDDCVKVKLRRGVYSDNVWNLSFSSRANYLCLMERGVLYTQVEFLQIPLGLVLWLKSCHSQNCLN